MTPVKRRNGSAIAFFWRDPVDPLPVSAALKAALSIRTRRTLISLRQVLAVVCERLLSAVSPPSPAARSP